LSAFRLDQAGWCAGCEHERSPNFAAREEGVEPVLVVIHAISLPPREFGGRAVAQLFTNTLPTHAHPYYAGISHLRVSSHFFVRRDGTVVQFVSCNDVAWHAGVSRWQGRTQCNGFSIGIELEGCDELPFEVQQYTALTGLLAAIALRYPGVRSAAGHSEIAPERKTDPGPCFDWSDLSEPWRAWIATAQSPSGMG
jgi:AmpD protein